MKLQLFFLLVILQFNHECCGYNPDHDYYDTSFERAKKEHNEQFGMAVGVFVFVVIILPLLCIGGVILIVCCVVISMNKSKQKNRPQGGRVVQPAQQPQQPDQQPQQQPYQQPQQQPQPAPSYQQPQYSPSNQQPQQSPSY